MEGARSVRLGTHMDVIGAKTRFDAAHTSRRSVENVRPFQAALHRTVDILLATGILVVLSPLLVAVAVLVKATSRGPTLYTQTRVGYGGRTFRVLKFRTMRVDAERDTGPVWATDEDARCTWVGAHLRRWSVDELPQLINVIRGDMALVGPRPERPFFVNRFERSLPDYHVRHAVRPGLTGWAQIHGWRGNTSIEERLAHDLYYVRHRSLRLDLKVIIQTPYALLFPKQMHATSPPEAAVAADDRS